MAVTADIGGMTGLWTDVYILRRFVDMLKAELVFSTYSEPAQIPKNTGGYVARWNIPRTFDGSTTVVTEASAGTVAERTSTEFATAESTINTYGEWMRLGEIAKDSWTRGSMEAIAEQFAFAGADVIDTLLRNAAQTAANFLHSGDTATGGAALTASDQATTADFITIAGYFHRNNAKGFRSLMGDYAWIMHPDQEVDLTSEFTTSQLSWTNINRHVPEGFGQLIRTHRFVGRYAGVTAIRTTKIQTVTEDVTAYKSVALARWGLGWAGLGEAGPSAPQIIRKSPNANDTSQPLSLYDTIGYKVKMAERLLDDNRVLIVYSNPTRFN